MATSLRPEGVAIDALLHDPRDGRAVRGRLVAEGTAPPGIRFEGDGVSCAVPIESATFESGGWDGTSMHLLWEDGAGRWAITITRRADLERLVPHLPGALAPALAGVLRESERVTRRRWAAWAVAAAIVALPLLLVALVVLFREQLLAEVVTRLPLSVDARLGELLEQELVASKDTPVVTDGPALDGTRAVAQRLFAVAPRSGHRLRVHLVVDRAVNAYAAPGGLIVVHTGLLHAADGPHEVAGVIAHEITHVLERHTLRQLVFRAGVVAAARAWLGSPDGAAGALTGAALDLTSLRFSREQEEAADRGAARLLLDAGLPADGLARFFERLGEQGGEPPVLLSSHPAPAERAAALRAQAAHSDSPATRAFELDWNAVRAHAAALEGRDVLRLPDESLTRGRARRAAGGARAW